MSEGLLAATGTALSESTVPMMRTRLLTVLLIAGGLSVVSMTYLSYAAISSTGARQSQGILQEGGAIKGRVLYADGRPVSDAVVHAMKSDMSMGRLPSVCTDEQGEFLFEDLIPGTYTIYASKEEEGYPRTNSSFYFGDAVNTPEVSVYAQQTTSYVVVQFGLPAAKLMGRMVSALNNKPIPGHSIQITLRLVDRPNEYFSTGPDTDGNFEILAPPVPFKIEASAPGFEKWRYRSGDSSNAADYLQLTPGASKNLNIILRPVR